MTSDLFGDSGATFSPCRTYRYAWWRRWAPGPVALIVGLNPSYGDESVDDRTNGRCIRFAAAWGYSAVVMANLFAVCATKRKDMLAHPSPIGPENDEWLARLAADADIVVAAWGESGGHLGRDQEVIAMLPQLHALALTKDGQPRHPLYLKGHLKPFEWRINAV